MNAIDYIEDYQDDVMALIEQLEKMTPYSVKSREELFHKIKSELAHHEESEEQLLHPECASKNHNYNELDETAVSDDAWIAGLFAMRADIEDHVKDDREKAFALAFNLFDKSASQLQSVVS